MVRPEDQVSNITKPNQSTTIQTTPTPDPDIPEISTLIIALTFNTFSADWFAKAHAGEAPPENESQFNWSWVD